MPQRPNRRVRLIAAAAAAALVLIGVGTWLLWPDEPRQREYLDVTACLLTDENGVTSAPAKPVWAALQEASVDSRARVQYLAVAGPQTVANARAHVAALTGGQCGLVLAAGPAQIDAVLAAAPTYPKVRFITVDGGAANGNVTVIATDPADALRATIDDELTTLADAAD